MSSEAQNEQLTKTIKSMHGIKSAWYNSDMTSINITARSMAVLLAAAADFQRMGMKIISIIEPGPFTSDYIGTLVK